MMEKCQLGEEQVMYLYDATIPSLVGAARSKHPVPIAYHWWKPAVKVFQPFCHGSVEMAAVMVAETVMEMEMCK